mmetsp:Transcript_16900/g.34787  ORF Transcript_16900/g.34787 Transcript_16900/m.34787 type:complete len:84 (-) Transcript_16900:9-260(-)
MRCHIDYEFRNLHTMIIPIVFRINHKFIGNNDNASVIFNTLRNKKHFEKRDTRSILSIMHEVLCTTRATSPASFQPFFTTTIT